MLLGKNRLTQLEEPGHPTLRPWASAKSGVIRNQCKWAPPSSQRPEGTGRDRAALTLRGENLGQEAGQENPAGLGKLGSLKVGTAPAVLDTQHAQNAGVGAIHVGVSEIVAGACDGMKLVLYQLRSRDLGPAPASPRSALPPSPRAGPPRQAAQSSRPGHECTRPPGGTPASP